MGKIQSKIKMSNKTIIILCVTFLLALAIIVGEDVESMLRMLSILIGLGG